MGGGLASKQTKMLDNYLTYDLGKWEGMNSLQLFREEDMGKPESWKGQDTGIKELFRMALWV